MRLVQSCCFRTSTPNSQCLNDIRSCHEHAEPKKPMYTHRCEHDIRQLQVIIHDGFLSKVNVHPPCTARNIHCSVYESSLFEYIHPRCTAWNVNVDRNASLKNINVLVTTEGVMSEVRSWSAPARQLSGRPTVAGTDQLNSLIFIKSKVMIDQSAYITASVPTLPSSLLSRF